MICKCHAGTWAKLLRTVVDSRVFILRSVEITGCVAVCVCACVCTCVRVSRVCACVSVSVCLSV